MMFRPDPSHIEFLERWLGPLHEHVALVYPFAETERTVREVFRVAPDDRDRDAAPGERAWLFALARRIVYSSTPDPSVFRRRNADAVTFSMRDAAASLDGQQRTDAIRAIDAFTALGAEQRDVLRIQTVERLSPNELGWILHIDQESARTLVDELVGLVRSAQDRQPPSHGEPTDG